MSFFDPLSFVIGTGVGVAASAGGYFVLKDRLPGVLRNTPQDSESPSNEGGRAAALQLTGAQNLPRYAADMENFFLHRHLPSRALKLTDVLIEPRFLRGRMPKLALEKDETGLIVETDIYRVIPLLHQYPALYAGFNMETISLRDLETGQPHIAILGVPGSGKTTALMTLGLIALGKLNPEKAFKDDQEAQFNAHKDDEGLPPEVQERRRKEREEVQRRAIEQLRIIQKRTEEIEEIEQRDQALDLEDLVPLYVHLHDVDLNPAHYGGQIDPAEPFIRALGRYVSKRVYENSAPMLYRFMDEGKALLLIDGYDDLLPEERLAYTEWLSAIKELYGQNLIFVTGPAVGYDGLMTLGYAPTFIRPLNGRLTQDLIDKWINHWETHHSLPDQNALSSLKVDMRNRSALDVTLKLWATLSDDIQQTGRRGYYDFYVRGHISAIPQGIEIAQDAAKYWLDKGQAPDRDALRRIARKRLGLPDLDPMSDIDEYDEFAKAQAKGKNKGKNGATVSSKHEEDKTLGQLAETGLIIEKPNGAWGFIHPTMGWYLAAETLEGADANRLGELADYPAWHQALSFASAFVDLEPTVLKRAMRQQDLFFDSMFSVVDWMPDTPQGLRWTGEILKRLGAALMAPQQFPSVREYAVAALVSARDSSGGVVYILRQAVRSGNPDLRRLGCLGLGALGATEAINDITQMLFDDVVEVQLAAGLALGAIGTEDALRGMIEALLSGEENLRKAVAEAMAAIPGEGHEILFDGITHEDLLVRRACAYGLARIPATWALVALYRAMLEDSQWYVRQAAETAFAQAREPRSSGPQPYPEPDRYEWLNEWAAARGEAVPEGLNGRQVLMRALQEAPTQIQIEAARALGHLAHLPAIKALYTSLGDQSADVRSAAFGALGQMSERIGQPMPGVL